MGGTGQPPVPLSIMSNELETFFSLTNQFPKYTTPQTQAQLKGDTVVNTPIVAETPVKHDTNKTDWSLMPWECVEEINRVLEFGAVKYSAHNWKSGTGFVWTRVFSSLLRHLFSWVRGEDRDPETGLSHLAHAGCNIIFLLYYSRHPERFTGDDRQKQ